MRLVFRRVTRHLLAASSLAFAAAGCRSTEPLPTTIEQAVFADTLDIELARFERLPGGLYRRDSIVGSGRMAVSGDSISVRYVGRFPDAAVFDQNPAPRPVYSFRLGQGRVIAGWDQGLPTMRVGGLRQLIIPPELGYGPRDYLSIPGNSILVFTIDLVAVH